MSRSGHCRAFDAKAQGTSWGSGIGIVLLKPLAAARADRDTIYAVIKGSAVNNDGSLKVGFTAPGVEGQAEVVANAQARAGVKPESISYIEAHGTGTLLGDPIEIAALTRAFRAGTDKKQFCALGAVKTNIGHLDTAAGIAGLFQMGIRAANAKRTHASAPGGAIGWPVAKPVVDIKGAVREIDFRVSVMKMEGRWNLLVLEG